MKKTILSITLFLTLVLTTVNMSTAENETIFVDDDGTAEYTSIQQAINDATDGDTVFVYSGTYQEQLHIQKSINLIGENKETTIIDAQGDQSVIWIQPIDHILSPSLTKVSISDFTLQNSGTSWMESGIVLWNCKQCIITNTIIQDCAWGIYIGISEEITVSSNNLIQNERGIQLTDTKNCEISSNTIKDNSRHGIYLNSAKFDTITENNFINNKRHLGFYGVYFTSIDGNYWDQSINLPIKPFIGKHGLLLPIPGLMFDWNPAAQPYTL